MSQNLSTKKSNFVSRTVGGVSSLLGAIETLISLRMEYDSLGIGPGSGTPFEVTQADIDGANAHLTPQEVGDAFTSLDALKTLLLQGHLTNLNKLRP